MSKRAPVQGERKDAWSLVPYGFADRWCESNRSRIPDGTIPWADFLSVYESYAEKYGRSQSPERIAERGGFGILEIMRLGHTEVLDRWRPAR